MESIEGKKRIKEGNKKVENKYIIGSTIVAITIFSAMAYTIKTQHDIIKSISENTAEQKKLKDDIVRINAQLITKEDLEKKIKEANLDLSVIKAEMKKIGGDVAGLVQIAGITPGGYWDDIPSSGFIPIPKPQNDPPTGGTAVNCPATTGLVSNCYVDKYGYFSNIQLLNLAEPLGDNKQAPFGTVQFNATKEKPWSYKVLPREYSAGVVIGVDKAGRKLAFTKIMIKPNDGSGKVYSLPEVKSEYYESLPKASFHWWNPRAMVGFDMGVSSEPKFSSMPVVQMFISSYGELQVKPKWFIGGIGLGYNIPTSTPVAVVTPFAYKITDDKSIFQNINLSPSIAVDMKTNIYGFVGLRFSL